MRALIAWGLFKPVVSNPATWSNETVATAGQLWDVGYRFTTPPDAVVTFKQSGDSVSVSAAGSSVTLTSVGGCTVDTATPAAVTLPRRCWVTASARRKRKKHHRSKRRRSARP
jgi:hypothetical protein